MYYPMNNFAYVNSFEEAKNYPIQPSQNLILIDSSKPYIYMKSASQMGCPAIKCFEIKEVDETKLTNNITKDDLQEIIKRLDALENRNESSI